MDLSIIIVNYNTYELTCQCIDSIKNQTKDILFEIILIDNNSDEVHPSQFKTKYSEIKLIHNKKNIGFGRANNQGMEISTGRYLLCLNSDTIIINNALDKSCFFMDSSLGIDYGGFNCKQVNAKGEVFGVKNLTKKEYSLSYQLLKSNLFFKLIKKHFIRPKQILHDKIIQLESLSGAFLFIRKEVYDKVGGFDPNIFMYWEDRELCEQRISKLFKLCYNPFISIIHLEGKSSTSNEKHIMSYNSKFYTFQKLGSFKFFLFKVICFQNIITRLLLAFLKSNNRESHLFQIKTLIQLLLRKDYKHNFNN